MPRPAHFDLDKTNSDEETAYIELPLEALTLLVSTSENALLAYARHPGDPELGRQSGEEWLAKHS